MQEIHVFDFDGTIVDLAVDWFSLRSNLQHTLGLSYQQCSISQIVERVVGEQGWNGRRCLARLIEAYEQPGGMVSFSKKLSITKYIMGLEKYYIISNNLSSTINRVLPLIGLERNCYGIIGFEDVLFSKPHVASYELLMHRYFKEYSNALNIFYYGDRDTDELFAKTTNMRFVRVG